MSLASAAAAEARRKAATTLGYHNLKLGPTAWNFSTGLGLEYTDNLYFREEDTRADLGLRPYISARMLWPVSDKNSISLSLGGGYSFYLDNPEFNRYFITPGTELSFDIYVGDWWFTLHDRLTIVQDVYQDPSIVGSANHSRLENSLGFTAVWDLNKIISTIGYDHTIFTSIQAGGSSGESPYPDGQSDAIYGSLGYVLGKDRMAGLEYGLGSSTYELSSTNLIISYADSLQWNVGVFAESQVSEYIKGRASVGYTMYMPDRDDADDEGGIYAELGVTHRVNKYLDYSLKGGRRISFSFYGGTLDMYTAHFAANWRFIRKVALTTGFTYEHGSYLYGYDEDFDRYIPSVQVSRMITEKLGATIGYRLYLRESNVPNRNYTANIFDLTFGYRF